MSRERQRKAADRPAYSTAAFFVGILGTIATGGAAAQSAPELYAGKQIRMVIASGAGGGYDSYARLLARHMKKYIPGNPSFIDQNMPNASGMQATNWAYGIAPKDGTVILATYNSLLAEPLYGNSAVTYDPLKFEMIGSMAQQQNICLTWHTSQVKTIEQAKAQEVIVTATGVSGDSATMPKIVNTMFGTKFRVVTGYTTPQSRLAVERGEADGVCGLSYSTLKASNPDWIENKRVNVLLQTGSKRHPNLPDVPTMLDLACSPEQKQVIQLLSFPQEMGRPFLMPPGTPKEMVAAIREAFNATLKDPEFLAEAAKMSLEIDPLTGEDMQRILQNAYATPKALIEKAQELNGSASR
jgi:tripartite-type tricarboxylate transporter receptor subunit TctC